MITNKCWLMYTTYKYHRQYLQATKNHKNKNNFVSFLYLNIVIILSNNKKLMNDFMQCKKIYPILKLNLYTNITRFSITLHNTKIRNCDYIFVYSSTCMYSIYEFTEW